MPTFTLYHRTQNGVVRVGILRGKDMRSAFRNYYRSRKDPGPVADYYLTQRAPLFGRWGDYGPDVPATKLMED